MKIFILSIIILLTGCSSLQKPETITVTEYVDKECVVNTPDEFFSKDVDFYILIKKRNIMNIDDLLDIDLKYIDRVFLLSHEYYDIYTWYKNNLNVDIFREKYIFEMFFILTSGDYEDLSYNQAEQLRYIRQANAIIRRCKGN